MHLTVVVSNQMYLNYMWLPGFLWTNERLQIDVLSFAKKEFESKHKRNPSTEEEDLKELDRHIIKRLCAKVPARGFSRYLRALLAVELTQNSLAKFDFGTQVPDTTEDSAEAAGEDNLQEAR